MAAPRKTQRISQDRNGGIIIRQLRNLAVLAAYLKEGARQRTANTAQRTMIRRKSINKAVIRKTKASMAEKLKIAIAIGAKDLEITENTNTITEDNITEILNCSICIC